MTEKDELTSLIKRCDLSPITRDYLYAIPSKGTSHPYAFKYFTSQGYKGGVPNVCLPYPSGKYHGLYLLLKVRTASMSTVTANQQIWINRLRDIGYAAYVAFGHDEAWDIIQKYLKKIPINSIKNRQPKLRIDHEQIDSIEAKKAA